MYQKAGCSPGCVYKRVFYYRRGKRPQWDFNIFRENHRAACPGQWRLSAFPGRPAAAPRRGRRSHNAKPRSSGQRGRLSVSRARATRPGLPSLAQRPRWKTRAAQRARAQERCHGVRMSCLPAEDSSGQVARARCAAGRLRERAGSGRLRLDAREARGGLAPRPGATAPRVASACTRRCAGPLSPLERAASRISRKLRMSR